MEGTLIVAVYAAVVATAGFAWQVFQWRHARANRVEVEVKLAIFPMTHGGVRDGVTIEATNPGDRPLRVTSAGLDMQDGSGRTMVVVQMPPGATIPGPIDARDSGMTYFFREEVEGAGVNLLERLTGWVRLATGELCRSRPRTLFSG